MNAQFTSESFKTIIEDIYNKGLAKFYGESLSTIESHSIIPCVKTADVNYYPHTINAQSFGKSLIDDNIMHIILEVLFENSIFNYTKTEIVDTVCNHYELNDPDDKNFNNLYSIITKHRYGKINKEDKNILLKKIVKNTSYDFLLSNNTKINIHSCETYIWLHFFLDKLLTLDTMNYNDIKKLTKAILNQSDTIKGTLCKKMYINKPDDSDSILKYNFIEQICRISLIIALDEYASKHLLSKTYNTNSAYILNEIGQACIEYPFAYKKIIDKIIKEGQRNYFLYINIIQNCVYAKKYCKELLQNAYNNNLISLNEMSMFINDNVKYYSPHIKTNCWLNYKQYSSTPYIINITSIVHLINTTSFEERYSKEDFYNNYVVNFPCNKIYIDYMKSKKKILF